MKTVAVASRKRALPAPPTQADDLYGLIRRVIVMLAQSAGSTAHAGAPEVLLDIEMEGIRCVFTRRPHGHCFMDDTLTPREIEIARLVAKGYANKTIAGVLEISSFTVDTYLRRIFAKVKVTSRAAMVAHLSEQGRLNEPCVKSASAEGSQPRR